MTPYMPRHDGVKLEPNQLHDPAVRKTVFDENVKHIDDADIVIASLDSKDGYIDTGTIWEVGYAMAVGKPVIGFQYDEDGKIEETIPALVDGLLEICTGEEELLYTIHHLPNTKESHGLRLIPVGSRGSKVLFVAPDRTEDQRNLGVTLSSILIECSGKEFRWVDDLSCKTLFENMSAIFDNVNYMVAVIDDRHPVVSWMMGVAYAYGIPIVTYTDHDYGVNLMLMLSLKQHVKGQDELKSLLQAIKRNGIDNLEDFDDSNIKVF